MPSTAPFDDTHSFAVNVALAPELAPFAPVAQLSLEVDGRTTLARNVGEIPAFGFSIGCGDQPSPYGPQPSNQSDSGCTTTNHHGSELGAFAALVALTLVFARRTAYRRKNGG